MRRSNTNPGKKFKKPKHKIQATTNPDAPRHPSHHRNDEDRSECPTQECPLLAKDSEWVDIVQPQRPGPAPSRSSNSSFGDEEAILQLVECEEGPESEPLAIMFPGLLERDPKTFEGMLTKVMSTTEVTRNLVDLGTKANFHFVKKSDRLIPRDKKWLDKVSEADDTNNSQTSFDSKILNNSVTSANDADDENTDKEAILVKKKKRRLSPDSYACSSKQANSRARTSSSSVSTNTRNFNNVTIAALAMVDEKTQKSKRTSNDDVPNEKTKRKSK